MVSRLRIPLFFLLAALPLGLVACSSDTLICEDGVCRYCDGLGCRPVEAECGSAADCDVGEDCVAGLCQSEQVECSADDPCDGEQWCSGGTCRGDEPACTHDEECGDGERCSAGTCRDEDHLCQFNHECGSSRICIDGRCVAECTGDTHCTGEGQVCDDGLCRCDTEDCVEDDHPRSFCTPDDGCAEDLPCVDGVCRTPCDEGDHDACQRFDVQFTFCLDGYCATTNEVTTDCELSSDCEAGQDCIDGVCR